MISISTIIEIYSSQSPPATSTTYSTCPTKQTAEIKSMMPTLHPRSPHAFTVASLASPHALTPYRKKNKPRENLRGGLRNSKLIPAVEADRGLRNSKLIPAVEDLPDSGRGSPPPRFRPWKPWRTASDRGRGKTAPWRTVSDRGRGGMAVEEGRGPRRAAAASCRTQPWKTASGCCRS